jgi:hypothetical protein
MAYSTPKLKAGATLFDYNEGEGKYFHLPSALPSPIYPARSRAFKLAADLILDSHQSAPGPEHNDALQFPVLCLYRHCIELILKDLIRLAIRCDFFDGNTIEQMRDKKNGMLGKHNLLDLWEKAKAFLEHRYPNEEQVPLAEPHIQKLHMIDPTGQTTRYELKKGTWEFNRYEGHPAVIGVTNLRQRMDELYYFLDSCYGHQLELCQITWESMDHANDY